MIVAKHTQCQKAILRKIFPCSFPIAEAEAVARVCVGMLAVVFSLLLKIPYKTIKFNKVYAKNFIPLFRSQKRAQNSVNKK
jgi:hypothetical protein